MAASGLGVTPRERELRVWAVTGTAARIRIVA